MTLVGRLAHVTTTPPVIRMVNRHLWTATRCPQARPAGRGRRATNLDGDPMSSPTDPLDSSAVAGNHPGAGHAFPENWPSTPTPPAVSTACGLLLLLADTAPDPLDRLVASAALARVSAVHPPYPPAETAVIPVRGDALLDEAIDALITAAEEATDAAERARALLAIEELSGPLTLPALPTARTTAP